MEFNIGNINRFLLWKLPSAYLVGIRIKHIDAEKTIFSVKHRWISQNPFQSMYFGVQAMAAEISTGVLVMKNIKDSGANISMLVTHQQGTFTKKATGRITFSCTDGAIIKEVIAQAITSRQPQTLILKANGLNEKGEIVSHFDFHWGLKVR
ncbi:MAG: DUF4442 domain-containing protein [Flavobacteriaceae bacterium]|jgi:hypothetical protein|nr:DUF4442 domain-containing protein [Flavobacteriaceae bacterium]